MKIAIKREQSQARLSYAEREQFGATLKKQYEKPSMKVYELSQRARLLVGSSPQDGDQWLNYAPGIGEDRNHLA